MANNSLTDARCRGAKPQDKPYKLFDGGGLALWCSPTGAKVWRLHYRRQINGVAKPQTMSFGPYPEVSLAEARRKRDEARKALRDGADPMAKRKAQPSKTFRETFDAYWTGRQNITDAYRTNAVRCMEMHIYPSIGDRGVDSLTKDDLWVPLNKRNDRGLFDYVRKARIWMSAAFDRAVAQGHCQHNPAAEIDPKNAFGQRRRVRFAAIDPREVPALMQRLALEDPHLQSMLACRFLAYTWLRTKEMRTLLWTDLVEPGLIIIPEERMKKRREHMVPLPRQAQEIFEQMRARSRGSRYVWPGERSLDRTMSENAVLYLLHRAGFKGEMTGHGWRSTASTWANERGWNPDAVEMQLAHHDDTVRGTYNRSKYLEERRTMLQAWADWLDEQGSREA
jgi:integrase